jgi:hypothetical protein
MGRVPYFVAEAVTPRPRAQRPSRSRSRIGKPPDARSQASAYLRTLTFAAAAARSYRFRPETAEPGCTRAIELRPLDQQHAALTTAKASLIS